MLHSKYASAADLQMSCKKNIIFRGQKSWLRSTETTKLDVKYGDPAIIWMLPLDASVSGFQFVNSGTLGCLSPEVNEEKQPVANKLHFQNIKSSWIKKSWKLVSKVILLSSQKPFPHFKNLRVVEVVRNLLCLLGLSILYRCTIIMILRRKKTKYFANYFSYTCKPEKTEKFNIPFKSVSAFLLVLGYFYLATSDLLKITNVC